MHVDYNRDHDYLILVDVKAVTQVLF